MIWSMMEKLWNSWKLARVSVQSPLRAHRLIISDSWRSSRRRRSRYRTFLPKSCLVRCEHTQKGSWRVQHTAAQEEPNPTQAFSSLNLKTSSDLMFGNQAKWGFRVYVQNKIMSSSWFCFHIYQRVWLYVAPTRVHFKILMWLRVPKARWKRTLFMDDFCLYSSSTSCTVWT